MTDTKEHILRVAYRLFLEKTYKEVTIEQIVRRSRVSKGAFYHYFSSKKAVFLETLDLHFFSIMSTTFDGFSRSSLHEFYVDYLSGASRIMQSVTEPEGDTRNTLNLFSLIFDGLRLFPEFREKMLKAWRDEQTVWERIVTAARGSGEIKSPLSDAQIARIFICISDGVALMQVRGTSLEKMKEELHTLWDSFYQQLTA